MTARTAACAAIQLRAARLIAVAPRVAQVNAHAARIGAIALAHIRAAEALVPRVPLTTPVFLTRD